MAEASVMKQSTWRGGLTTGVSFDLQGAFEVKRGLEALVDRLPWFQERAIQTLYRRLPVEARRDIQAEYNISAARVRDHMAIRYLESSTARRAGVRLFGQWKRGIGLLNFSARQTRKGVSYSVYSGRRKTEAHAFIARLRSGNRQVVQRYGEKNWTRTYKDRKGTSRTRVDQRYEVLYRSTVAQMLARGRRPERLLDFSKGVIQSEVERQFDSYLRTSGGAR